MSSLIVRSDFPTTRRPLAFHCIRATVARCKTRKQSEPDPTRAENRAEHFCSSFAYSGHELLTSSTAAALCVASESYDSKQAGVDRVMYYGCSRKEESSFPLKVPHDIKAAYRPDFLGLRVHKPVQLGSCN